MLFPQTHSAATGHPLLGWQCDTGNGRVWGIADRQLSLEYRGELEVACATTAEDETYPLDGHNLPAGGIDSWSMTALIGSVG